MVNNSLTDRGAERSNPRGLLRVGLPFKTPKKTVCWSFLCFIIRLRNIEARAEKVS